MCVAAAAASCRTYIHDEAMAGVASPRCQNRLTEQLLCCRRLSQVHPGRAHGWRCLSTLRKKTNRTSALPPPPAAGTSRTRSAAWMSGGRPSALRSLCWRYWFCCPWLQRRRMLWRLALPPTSSEGRPAGGPAWGRLLRAAQLWKPTLALPLRERWRRARLERLGQQAAG